MPLDPQIKVILDQIDALGLPPHYEVGAVQARANAASRPRAQGPEVTSVENRSIAGPDGQVPIRIYKPAGSGPFPAIVWAHGGGMVIGTLETCDYICRKLCVNVGCVVVSVDYRLAPEHTFPAAPHDFYEATKWVADNAGELGVDVGRISVGGESAGANLAAAVALMARDRSGPSLVHQTLINPMLDTNFDTASYLENAEGYFLTRKTMMWYWEQYLGKPDGTNEPYAAPLCCAAAGPRRVGPAACIVNCRRVRPAARRDGGLCCTTASRRRCYDLHSIRRWCAQLLQHASHSGQSHPGSRPDVGSIEIRFCCGRRTMTQDGQKIEDIKLKVEQGPDVHSVIAQEERAVGAGNGAVARLR